MYSQVVRKFYLKTFLKVNVTTTVDNLGLNNIKCLRRKMSSLLGYSISVESSLSASGYDGIVYVSSNPPELDKSAPDAIKDALSRAIKVDAALFSEGGVMEVNLPAGRMVYSPTGPLSDYHDVRSFGEAAKKGILRSLKAEFQSPLLVLNQNLKFPNCDLVTILGAMEALYMNIQWREDCPDKCPKVKNLGVWSQDHSKLVETVDLAKKLESGRIVARDIADCDPERMAPPRVEEYVKQTFPSGCGISVSVVSDEGKLTKDYPLYAAVNRAASVIERHKGRIIYLQYDPPGPVEDTVLLVGKGVTYDTGGADIKAGGVMAGMSRDKCGAAAVAGFMKVVAEMKPQNLKVIGAMSMVRNSVGENCYVADEVIRARSGVRVRVNNTDAEGRMIMADVLCYMKELVEKKEAAVNPHLITIATLTGHAFLTVGAGYNLAMNNGPAHKDQEARKLQESGEAVGDPVDISRLRREDFTFHKGKSEGDDVFQANNEPSTRTPRGHQGPAAFLIMASGLDKHGLDSSLPIKYSHLDIAGGAGSLPKPATASPVLALAHRYLL
ncbi:putative aminopeptidase W07G4.4 isoform X1 [Homalodisca vitripennis]|uniref:putative aminopeptidase W07G4.4 isoform X1 n=2 Tax=Homalodisca vitripennis TaxID=197043 RepID=UPI001EE9B99D|nr:putative aminopeptidase W07G4.4 isoform X1 [Homalodisca vitripennis]